MQGVAKRFLEVAIVKKLKRTNMLQIFLIQATCENKIFFQTLRLLHECQFVKQLTHALVKKVELALMHIVLI